MYFITEYMFSNKVRAKSLIFHKGSSSGKSCFDIFIIFHKKSMIKIMIFHYT